MIHIDPASVKNLAHEHYLACKADVEIRLAFSMMFYELTINSTKTHVKVKSFTNTFGISPLSLNYFIENYFFKKYQKKTKKQPLKRVELLESLFFQGNRYMLDVNKINANKKLIFLREIATDLDKILEGFPSDLKKYTSEESEQLQLEYRGLINFIFQYETLGKDKGEAFGQDKNWNSYEITKKLGIKVCPYCNKNWINTVVNENEDKITNPQLDHFFPQSVFPLLRLSFYNFIPSCETCNSRIKRSTVLPLDEYTHPYVEGFDPEFFIDPIPLDTASSQGVGEDFMFHLECDDKSEKYKRALKSFEFFKIDNVYEHHGDIVAEIYYRKTKYGLSRIEDLLSLEMFKGMSIEEAYRIVFSNYFDDKDFNRRPFSKLTKDTLRSLEVI